MTKEAVKEMTAARRECRTNQARSGPITLYRVFWVFFIAGVVGDIIEVVFWLVTRGELISRSSLLYGPFSIVWGLGAVLMTLAFHKSGDRSTSKIFWMGTILGGVYEYACSWVQELAFGVCFWDYRHLPLNLNGRVNLIFCLFWGAAAVVWVRLADPALCAFIARIPKQTGKRLARVMALFLVCSTILSAAALYRMDQRQEGVPASGAVTQFLDERYPDEVLQNRYRNMGHMD